MLRHRMRSKNELQHYPLSNKRSSDFGLGWRPNRLRYEALWE